METEETLFPLVCRMAVDLGGMVLATIRQLNPETNLLESVESYGSGADYLNNITISASDAVPEGKGPAGTSFRESKMVIISHYQTNEMTQPWHNRAKRYGWGSSGTFPILRGGKPFASLGVYHSDDEAFDSEAIDLLDEVARDVSFALDSFDREKERRKARSDLLASERHFRAYFDYAMVGMAAASITTGTLLEVNEALCRMLGYSAAELIQMTWAEITHPEDVEKSAAAVKQILLGEAANFELNKRYVGKNGNIIHAHIASRGVPDETGTLSYLVTIIDDITEIKNHESQLEHLIHHDPLTGLPNRVLLNDRLDMAVSRANRSGQNIAVCFMDLDGFKYINDKFGHAAGDTLLVEIAKRLSTISRSIDTVARLGGDEFILILNGISGEEECRHMLERIMEIIHKPLEIGGNEVQISTSIGVAIYPDHVTSGAALLRHADQAMYIAKQKGRGRIHFFDAVNDHLAQVRSEGLSRIEMGLQNNELVLYYQPVINMRSGKVVGMEALIRWQHPERGLLTPGEFMPLVENSEFEMRLAEWVITQGMEQMTAWQRQGLNITVSVNLPARYLQSHGFVDFIVPLISSHTEMASNAIRLEILETAALGDMGSAIKKMTECIKHGIQFSIDDFGTGYASLSYLRRLPADTIKIDQSFVQGMLEDMDDLSIVQGVIGLADAFQKRAVAEGVETVEHGTKLLAMGCEFGQGYGIARPMGAEHVVNWIKEFRLPSEWNELSIGAGI
jgi:diguanylate cyclase (GGDEF)-like protein/PAS domain S-box-containing protein